MNCFLCKRFRRFCKVKAAKNITKEITFQQGFKSSLDVYPLPPKHVRIYVNVKKKRETVLTKLGSISKATANKILIFYERASV